MLALGHREEASKWAGGGQRCMILLERQMPLIESQAALPHELDSLAHPVAWRLFQTILCLCRLCCLCRLVLDAAARRRRRRPRPAPKRARSLLTMVTRAHWMRGRKRFITLKLRTDF